jgi:hypothetical protein
MEVRPLIHASPAYATPVIRRTRALADLTAGLDVTAKRNTHCRTKKKLLASATGLNAGKKVYRIRTEELL